MAKVQELFSNLILDRSPAYPIGRRVQLLEGKQKDLEAIHIYIELADPSTYRKKKYFHISRLPVRSWLDSWIYENLVNDEEYEHYLEKYKGRIGPDDIDNYILAKLYRQQAIELLSKTKKSFNLDEWTKPRLRYWYRRRTNLYLKDGTELPFDSGTSVISLFILKQGHDKHILAIGAGGNSRAREEYTIFTTAFYLLGKEKPILHHLVRYDSHNTYHYIPTYQKPIITNTLGSNYELDSKLEKEMRENSIWLNDVLKKIP
ncbi:hypothetical protein MYX06_02255 [Patescibacteria group bacterium AH-259-L05]|nr:hypothetical protein [Patescibacteria group bacterium AH-259-L05]